VTDQRSDADRLRKVVRRATFYAYGLWAITIITAVGGAALIAWLLTRSGLPFLETWIVIVVVVLVPSLLRLVWRAVRERTRHRREP
jgi:membrane protein implicated in regulation of membrane protease activity